tara:strand:+ start:5708 stop:5872 length:165 start_codon:yes stop_codon:yes gene_type:complete
MKIGDNIRSKLTDRHGVIILFSNNGFFVLVDYTDSKGVIFRWLCIETIILSSSP